MAVLNDRSQGCSSLQDGALEFMVHRRLLKDDGRGVGQALNESGTDGQGLTVTGLHYLILSPTARLAALARLTAARVFAPVQPMLAPLSGTVADYIRSHRTNFSVIQTELPPSVELMTLQTNDIEKGVVLVRLAHQFGAREDAELSAPVQLDLSQLFAGVVDSVVELTLTGNQVRGAHKGYTWQTQGQRPADGSERSPPFLSNSNAGFNVTIGPAEIRSVYAHCLTPQPICRLPCGRAGLTVAASHYVPTLCRCAGW